MHGGVLLTGTLFRKTTKHWYKLNRQILLKRKPRFPFFVCKTLNKNAGAEHIKWSIFAGTQRSNSNPLNWKKTSIGISKTKLQSTAVDNRLIGDTVCD